jgi:hypothetical protein
LFNVFWVEFQQRLLLLLLWEIWLLLLLSVWEENVANVSIDRKFTKKSSKNEQLMNKTLKDIWKYKKKLALWTCKG